MNETDCLELCDLIAQWGHVGGVSLFFGHNHEGGIKDHACTIKDKDGKVLGHYQSTASARVVVLEALADYLFNKQEQNHDKG